ncbi:hypothetical protein JKP88DRAFT_262697 [Tribonema minus]|uniref:tubulin-glutamate carboxypeptidase n=1 Tax=Tribonema minus TaxID=303371 RepID=A0A835Z1I4_9STRA|nr:hypothetical protein JKP88DRAFT_262697 [Tribonema minus]
MTPVVRVGADGRWSRMPRSTVTFEEAPPPLPESGDSGAAAAAAGATTQLTLSYKFPAVAVPPGGVSFAFCYPHGYGDLQRHLAVPTHTYLPALSHGSDTEAALARAGAAVRSSSPPLPSAAIIYYHREALAASLEGRRLDLITVSDCTGIQPAREAYFERHHGLFPEGAADGGASPETAPEPAAVSQRPFKFAGKQVVFVSARVHPGETPSSFVLQGVLEFLLRQSDLRAAALRRRYVFKIVPMLNPDGVWRGHSRHDTLGKNLNRFYTSPCPRAQPTIFAVKKLLERLCSRADDSGPLKVYLDLHAHAVKRGCFIYGNHRDRIGGGGSAGKGEGQIENQLIPLLMTANSAHFDYGACNFSLKHMTRVDGGDGGMSAEGAGRVWCGQVGGVVRSYTLECNYNGGRAPTNRVPSAGPRRRRAHRRNISTVDSSAQLCPRIVVRIPPGACDCSCESCARRHGKDALTPADALSALIARNGGPCAAVVYFPNAPQGGQGPESALRIVRFRVANAEAASTATPAVVAARCCPMRRGGGVAWAQAKPLHRCALTQRAHPTQDDSAQLKRDAHRWRHAQRDHHAALRTSCVVSVARSGSDLGGALVGAAAAAAAWRALHRRRREQRDRRRRRRCRQRERRPRRHKVERQRLQRLARARRRLRGPPLLLLGARPLPRLQHLFLRWLRGAGGGASSRRS